MQPAKAVGRVWEGCGRGVGGVNLKKMTPISCNLGHSKIIFVTFSIAIFLGNFGIKF